MVHKEHNRSKNSGGFALIIFGALLLFLAPQEVTISAGLNIIAWVGGIIIGSIGFYLKFIRTRIKK
ncbi:MAG: hypothetical protein OEM77_08610 [Nitrosopumilus sp.]|nr:hypothetical protein [Nitrosopumilus sp.]MDH3736289.1 hypothetical protein [Nitrosopumilus sp.]MDH3823394.1 hypothetical protein [Nitrosopumilus sp.]MDH3832885.1 hypothetical protein [Nitrosopumilus sp.]